MTDKLSAEDLNNAVALIFLANSPIVDRALTTIIAHIASLTAEAERMREALNAITKLANLSKALLDDANAEARELREILSAIIDDTCSYICPSTGKVGEAIPHSDRCVRARTALKEQP